ncbi:RcpC/CpaB family pilus assembly protein [Vibrio sp. SS-MA-C1-2]|uniref:RcpC/CpaB family pilus assembly protein n=1 Tax=Vibrio sp. SS-MA-C1-2 TaxID=2908646 RepID=UPI001F2440E6|nr:RcpC/CpaB family pilus assembly protein [Vibrio sp. SS-MA-C1-2]UJF17520.1 RcpC/CpaB family pilus assembly protein [Vibrio sp. SS-MA-C1-2]
MNSRIIFIVSFSIIAFALYSVVDTINSRADAKANAAIQKATQKVKVEQLTFWQAKSDLSKGTVVSNSDFQKVILPKPEAVKIGFNQSVKLPLTADSILKESITEYQWITADFIANPKDRGYLDLLTTEGMVLYPLTISTSNLINNYIQSGDLVDIMAISSPTTNLSGATLRIGNYDGIQARILFNKVRVVAFEQKPKVTDDKKNKDKTPVSHLTISPRVSAAGEFQTTMVVEVDPENISKLALAQRTMYFEIYRSHPTKTIPEANVGDVINNYQGIRELRGNAVTEAAAPEAM